MTYLLGIEFSTSEKEILMHQRKYALELILETILSDAKPAITPMDTTTKFTTKAYGDYFRNLLETRDDLLTDVGSCQRLIGKLLYLIITRPNIHIVYRP